MEPTNDQGAPRPQTDGEVIDPPSDAEESQDEEAQDEGQQDDVDYKSLYETEQEKVADLTGKLKRATKPKSEPKKESKNITKETGDLDWGQKAYLRTEGIESTEFDFVQEQLDESNLPLEKLISNNYFKSQLQEFRDQKSAEKATPGKTRGATKSAKTEPAFWLDKDFKDVPEDMKRAVLNLKLEQETGARHSSQKIIYGNN